ncbi:hypothetical protein DFH09DRAFT_1205180 [Mycena vulgaris]|nr:hypothetical protein DFH09DRAFT_1205180 [Mycena vulgaris]
MPLYPTTEDAPDTLPINLKMFLDTTTNWRPPVGFNNASQAAEFFAILLEIVRIIQPVLEDPTASRLGDSNSVSRANCRKLWKTMLKETKKVAAKLRSFRKQDHVANSSDVPLVNSCQNWWEDRCRKLEGMSYKEDGILSWINEQGGILSRIKPLKNDGVARHNDSTNLKETLEKMKWFANSLTVPPTFAGLIDNPPTPAAAKVLKELLRQDYILHHRFFNGLGFDNHPGHHLVAACDMGAPPALLKLICEQEVPGLLPINRQGADITESNWTARLGERNAYESYLAFFADQISEHGVEGTMKKYLMAPEANENGAAMLGRFLGGPVHPLLHAGLGAEVGQAYMVAQGLALAAVTESEMSNFFLDKPSGLPEILTTSKGVTLLALLHEVYDSPILPCEPNTVGMSHLKQLAENPDSRAELKRIYSKWSIDTTLTGAASDAEFASKVEECVWQATLLLAATGKPNPAPRLDFFLMHILTSAFCLPNLLKILPDPVHKAQLLQGHARASAFLILLCGRPRIDIPLLMSYTEIPRPPAQGALPLGGPDALGNPASGETDPWLAIVQNALHHKDSHVIKAVRALYYGAQHFGRRGPGEAIGVRDASGKETHVGAETMDGTIFIRAAGGDWDRSALRWDAASEGED